MHTFANIRDLVVAFVVTLGVLLVMPEAAVA